MASLSELPVLNPCCHNARTVMAVVASVHVVVAMMMVVNRVSVVNPVTVVVESDEHQRRAIASTQLRLRVSLQLPHVFLLTLVEVAARLGIPPRRGFALRHFVRLLLPQSFSLTSELSAELIAAVKSLGHDRSGGQYGKRTQNH